MRIVPGRKCGFFLWVVRRVYGRTRFRVVVAELGVTILVRAFRHIFVGIMIMHRVIMRCRYRFASW